MEGICGIIDAQGFLVRGKFLVRELAWCGKTGSGVHYFTITSPRWSKLTAREKFMIHYCTQQVHGLEYGVSSLSQYNLQVFIQIVYGILQSPGKPKIGIKNNNLCKLLDWLNIPYVLLNKLDHGIPGISILLSPEGHRRCEYHQHLPGNYRCAIEKATALWSLVRKVAI